MVAKEKSDPWWKKAFRLPPTGAASVVIKGQRRTKVNTLEILDDIIIDVFGERGEEGGGRGCSTAGVQPEEPQHQQQQQHVNFLQEQKFRCLKSQLGSGSGSGGGGAGLAQSVWEKR